MRRRKGPGRRGPGNGVVGMTGDPGGGGVMCRDKWSYRSGLFMGVVTVITKMTEGTTPG